MLESISSAKAALKVKVETSEDFVGEAQAVVTYIKALADYDIEAGRALRIESDCRLGNAILALVSIDEFAYVKTISFARVVGPTDTQGEKLPDGMSILVNNVKDTKSQSNGHSGRKSDFTIVADGKLYTAKAYIDAFGDEKERAHSYYDQWPTELARRVERRVKAEVNNTELQAAVDAIPETSIAASS